MLYSKCTIHIKEMHLSHWHQTMYYIATIIRLQSGCRLALLPLLLPYEKFGGKL